MIWVNEFNSEHNREGLYDHLNSKSIFTLTSNNFCISTLIPFIQPHNSGVL